MCAAVCQEVQNSLHLVAEHGTVDALRDILKSNPDVNMQDYKGRTPLHLAIKGERLEHIKVLLDAGSRCDIFDVEGNSPLFCAVIRDDFSDAMSALLGSNPNLDIQNYVGRTALHFAAVLRRMKFVDVLLESGARYDILDSNQRTFMYYLIGVLHWRKLSRMSLSLLEKILEKTKEVEIVDHLTGDTAAHSILRSLYTSHVDDTTMKLVISKQKDLNIENRSGKTPLNFFMKASKCLISSISMDLICFMIQNGAYMNCQDCEIIMGKDALRSGLFGDVDFCVQAIMNEFSYKLLPKFYALLQTPIKIPSMELLKMTLLNQVSRVIRNDVRSEIGRKGYCDVSSMVTSSLSKRCIEAYVLHQSKISLKNKCMSSKETNSCIPGFAKEKRQRRN